MTTLLFLAIAIAGGLGAAARFVLDGLIRSATDIRLPWATILINISGSLLLGLVTGLAAGRVLPEAWQLILGTGFLGGYTTFSTASFETVGLLRDRRWVAAALNGFGVLVCSVAVAGAGLWLGLRV